MQIRPRPDRGYPAHPRTLDTIIVGAGMAGLACARRLEEARRPFLVIAEHMGGRVRRSRDGAVNLGAYYVRADYTHVNQFVDLGRRVDGMAIKRHDGTHSYTYWDPRLYLHLPQASRFLRSLLRFRRHYGLLKRRIPAIGQAAALRADPWLLDLYQRPALDWVGDRRLGDLARWYLAPGLHGTTFLSLDDISAFTLLLGAMPALVPTYEFTLRRDLVVDGFSDKILADEVTGVAATADGYLVETAGHGSWLTAHLVIATPTAVAARLIGLPATKQPAAAHMFQVNGELLPRFTIGDIHLFTETDPTLAIARQADGSILFCSREPGPAFSRFFSSWQVVERHHWNPAFHVGGFELLEAEQGPNLFLAGDHNIAGLEDSYLTGLYAANQIIARSGLVQLRRPRVPTMSGRRSAGLMPLEDVLS